MNGVEPANREHVSPVWRLTAAVSLLALTTLTCSETPTTSDVRDSAFGVTGPYPLVLIQPALDTISVGASRKYSAKLTDASGNTWTCGSCTWTSSDKLVATVSGVGTTTLKALKNGVVTLTAKTGSNTTGSLMIRVGAGGTGLVTPTIDVLPALDTITAGSNRTLSALLTDSTGNISTCGTCTWMSTDTTVAQVMGVGQATLQAVKAGSATITATSPNNISGSRTITVKPTVPPTVAYPLVNVQPALDTISVGANRVLSAVLTDASGTTWTCGSCTWTSSDATVATVSGVGTTTLRGLKNGLVTVTARTGSNTTGSRTIVVGVGPAGYPQVQVLPALDTITAGAGRTLSATLTNPLGSTTACSNCTWLSSDTTVARVSGVGDALLTALKAGTVTITATSANQTAGVRTLTVTNPPPPPTAYPLVQVLPLLDTIAAGASRALSARLTDAAGNSWICASCTWISSDPSVASVMGVGVTTLLAHNSGVVTVTATTGSNTSGSRAITVTGSPPTLGYPRVHVLPMPDTISMGASRALSALLTNAAGNTTTCGNCTWQSSDTTVARVTGVGQGLLWGLRAGVTTIIAASSGNNSGPATITVKYAPPPARGPVGFQVSPTGSPAGDGSAAQPWDLATALRHPAALQAGDTLWLRGGTYPGLFTSTLRGAPGAPILVRAYPGERVTIDGNITVTGSWGIYWGFEVMTSSVVRVSSQPGSAPTDIGPAGAGVDVLGPSNKFINLVVHDTHGGFGAPSAAVDTEIYGSLIYNNGWEAPDHGHGHGIYAQNLTGTKVISDNIIFNQFGWGIHIYGSAAAALRGFHVEGNAAFTNGSLSMLDRSNPDVLIGGGDSPAERITFTRNFTYQPGGARTVKLGYDELNEDLTATDNYLVGETQLINWRSIRFTGNVLTTGQTAPFGAKILLWHLEYGALMTGHSWHSNSYFVPASASNTPFSYANNGTLQHLSFADWRLTTGFDGNSVFTAGAPAGVDVFVRPNRYEAGRAHVIVYNWAGAGSAFADLTGVLHAGDAFEVRHAQDYYGAPVMTGVYAGGTVSIPLAARQPASPLGTGWAAPPVVSPTFNVFVVIKQ